MEEKQLLGNKYFFLATMGSVAIQFAVGGTELRGQHTINVNQYSDEASRIERCMFLLSRLARFNRMVPNLLGSLCRDARIHVPRLGLGDDAKVFKCAR